MFFAANRFGNADYSCQVDLGADLSPVSTVASTRSEGSSCSSQSGDRAEPGLLETYQGLFVKNTFYEFMPKPLCGSVTSSRRVQSLPACSTAPIPLAAPCNDAGLTLRVENPNSCPATGQRQRSRTARQTASAMPIPSFMPTQSFASEAQDIPGEHQQLDTPTLPVLRLAEALALPEVGDPEMPTVGSAQHDSGRCKPCAFVWKEVGCNSGVNCLYCHICGPNERRRRKKQQRGSHHLGLGSAAARGFNSTAKSGT